MNTPKRVRAKIRWLAPSEGGRSVPPRGPCYVTVARCGSSTIDWQKDAWSLVVEFYQSPDAVGEHTALGWFLAYESPKAPQSLLYTGNHFELTEGERVVAKGMIVEELDP